MDVSIGSQWESFAEDAVKSGRFGSASEAVRDRPLLDVLRAATARD